MNKTGNITETRLSGNTLPSFLWEAIFSTIYVIITLPGSVFLTGYLLHLGANNTQIGLLSTIPMLANTIAPVASSFVDRAASRKEIALKLARPVRILWLVSAFIPLLVLFNGFPNPLILFVFIFIVVSLGMVSAAIAWTSWMGEIIPEKVRGFYFGRRTVVAGIVSMIMGPILGRILDKTPDKHIGFSIIFGIGAAALLFSYYFLTRLPDAKNTVKIKENFSFGRIKEKVLKVFSDKNFMSLVKFNIAWTFTISFISVYVGVFMLKELKMSYTVISMFNIIVSAVLLSITPFWGKMTDRYGNKPVMLICGYAIGLAPVIWFLMTPSNYFIALPLVNVIGGIAWAGFGLAIFNLILKLAPREERPYFLSVNMLFTSVAAFLGPVCSGLLIDIIGTKRMDLGSYTGNFSFGVFQLIFILSVLMSFYPLSLLKKVTEPGDEDVGEVMQAVKTNIAGGFVEGMSVLFNYMMLPVATSGRVVKKLINKKQI